MFDLDSSFIRGVTLFACLAVFKAREVKSWRRIRHRSRVKIVNVAQ